MNRTVGRRHVNGIYHGQMPSPTVATSLIADVNFTAELDDMERPDQPGGDVQSAKRARRVRFERPLAIPTRIEVPLQPEAPAQVERLVQPEPVVPPSRPVDPERPIKRAKPIRLEVPATPVHVDEIGQSDGNS